MTTKILIVDDSAVTRMVLKKTIGMVDSEIRDIYQAANGREALALLAETNVDLIFADLNMPEMNGFEMIEHLKANQAYRNIPVYVISTESSTSRVQALCEKGIKGFVHKPFTPEMIRDALKSLSTLNTTS